MKELIFVLASLVQLGLLFYLTWMNIRGYKHFLKERRGETISKVEKREHLRRLLLTACCVLLILVVKQFTK